MNKRVILVASVATTLAAGLTAAILFPTTVPDIPKTNDEDNLIVQEDTCPCFKDEPSNLSCDSMKVITFQGCYYPKNPDSSCIKATTIYEEYPDSSSGVGHYLALGYYGGVERRIFLWFDLTGIVDDECRNPDLGFMAPFDSAQIVLYVVPNIQGVDYQGQKDRQFFIAAAAKDWIVGNNGEQLDSIQTLKTGSPAKNGPTWRTDSMNYWWPFNNQPRNLDFDAMYPGATPIDSIVFVCHRPMPYNSPIKRTLRNWIMVPDSVPNFGWVVMADSTQQVTRSKSALVIYSPTHPNKALHPKLTLWFTKGVDREDAPRCGAVKYVPVPRKESETTEQKKK
jgi:hypothetical protein